MIAQSYFELWDYKNAKTYLTKYYALDSNDKDVLYLLAIISQKTRDFVLSNIYLSKAEKLWYQPIENINRLQIYNAYILDDTWKILSNFDKLIKNQKKPLFNDLVLATYYNLINWNISKWEEYAQLWMTLYPKREDFYWFEWWILIEKNQLEQAKILLDKGQKINWNNALINLNLARLESKKWNKLKAKLYYKRAIKLDNWWEISKISAKFLEKLNKKEKTSSWNLSSTWITK
jgi:Tfp pilus assembly protein PilF